MVFELVSIYITLYLARKYYSKRYVNTISHNIEMLNNKFVLVLFVLLGTLIVFLVEPKLMIPQDFLVLMKIFKIFN